MPDQKHHDTYQLLEPWSSTTRLLMDVPPKLVWEYEFLPVSDSTRTGVHLEDLVTGSVFFLFDVQANIVGHSPSISPVLFHPDSNELQHLL